MKSASKKAKIFEIRQILKGKRDPKIKFWHMTNGVLENPKEHKEKYNPDDLNFYIHCISREKPNSDFYRNCIKSAGTDFESIKKNPPTFIHLTVPPED